MVNVPVAFAALWPASGWCRRAVTPSRAASTARRRALDGGAGDPRLRHHRGAGDELEHPWCCRRSPPGRARAGFVAWELAPPDPMLEPEVLPQPPVRGRARRVGLAFFALFGAIFALTQFLQVARGYAALEAGVRNRARASRSGSSWAPARAEARREAAVPLAVMAAGLLGVAARADALAAVERPTCRTGRSASAGLGSRCSWAGSWALATVAVMGSVPEARSGVASAIDDRHPPGRRRSSVPPWSAR